MIHNFRAVVAAVMMSATLCSLSAAQQRATRSVFGQTQQNYKTKCQSCHAADGSGNTTAGKSAGALDLRSSTVQAKTNADLAKIIENGQGNMPAFKNKLTDEQALALVGYIRRLAGKK